jgi:hypothetical protein
MAVTGWKACSFITIQSRVALSKLCWGPEVRAARAGSIGRERPGIKPQAPSPQREAGGLGLRHGEISASWFQAGPRARAPLGRMSLRHS